MTLLTTNIEPAEGMLDAYVDMTRPTTVLGVSDPARLSMGGTDAALTTRSTWVGFATGLNFGIPAGAQVGRATYITMIYYPKEVGAAPVTIYVKRILSALDSSMTWDILHTAELAAGNWPMTVWSSANYYLDVHPSLDYPVPLASVQTHTLRNLKIDVTAWWAGAANRDRGFILESPSLITFGLESFTGTLPKTNLLPSTSLYPAFELITNPLSTGVFFMPSRDAPVDYFAHGFIPQLLLEYGWPIGTLTVKDVAAHSAVLNPAGTSTSNVALHADGFSIELSTDNVTFKSLRDAPPGSTNYRLNLSPSTTYYARAAALYNGLGQLGATSNTVTFTTPAS